MLPSTSPSSSATNRPTPASTPASAAASTTEPSLVLPQRAPAVLAATATPTPTPPTPTISGALGLAYSPTIGLGVPLGAGQLSNDPSHQKRGPYFSLDGQSPDSSGSLPGNRDDVPAIPPDQRTKKRRTGPGSRGVANLTPEQLLKKRANDREAQRAIRERTKNQIESLERQIRELTAQQPYQELQKVLREKQAVEAQNAELRAHLATIVAGIQPLLSSNNTVTQQQHQQQQQLPPYPTHTSSTVDSESTLRSGTDSAQYDLELPRSSSPPDPGGHQLGMSVRQRHGFISIMNIEGDRFDASCVLGPSLCANRLRTGANEVQDLSSFQHRLKKQFPDGFSHHSHDSDTASSHSSHVPPVTWQYQFADHASSPSNSAKGPQLGTIPTMRYVPATCMLDDLLLKFVYQSRQYNAEHASTQEVEEQKHLSLPSLLNSANSSHPPSVAVFMTNILSTFNGISGVPEKVALLYNLIRTTRWLISPTQENFDLLLPFSRPLYLQYSKPYPIWMEYIVFPEMREKYILAWDCPENNFDEMFIPYTQTLSINWPYEDGDTLLEAPDGTEMIINPVFQRHFSRLENWTLGDAFDQAFPAFRGAYNLKSENCPPHQKNT